MGLLVVQPGPHATVQDLGRPGFRAWGVPVAGAFDRSALSLANALLGNPQDAAAIELTLFGGHFRAEIPLAIALTGAPMSAEVEAPGGSRRTLHIPQSASLDAGDHLRLGGTASGARAYLAVRGGWRTPIILGSRSNETALRAGDLLPADSEWTPVRRTSFEFATTHARNFPSADWPHSLALWRTSGSEVAGVRPDGAPIRVVDGPDADPSAIVSWQGLEFRISPQSDRMGVRLDGDRIHVTSDPGRVSTPVAPGAIQVTGGQPIVLGPACGTMGGYLVVAYVLSADFDRLAQLRPGDPINFERVELNEARRIDREWRRWRREWILRTTVAASDR